MPVFIKICCIALFAQGLLFISRMGSVISDRMEARKERAKRGIPFYWFEPTPKEVLETCDFYKRAMDKKIKLN